MWSQKAVSTLTASPALLKTIGVSNPATEILYGAALQATFGNIVDRIPDIVVAPDVGSLYSFSQVKVSDHGGCATQRVVT